jgi:N-acyl-D-amino-acid deacylase
MINDARNDGVDVKFDTYAYHCGNSVINVFLPKWFLSKTPEIFDDQSALNRLKREFFIIKNLLGFGYQDIQISYMNHPELNEYNGMFLPDIARKRKMDEFDCYIDIARKTKGRARVLNHRYSNLDNVKDLMRDPNSLYMTDAIPSPQGVQNPAAFGNFPLFLQYARDFKLNTLEEAVCKMTGATAERFKMKKRGLLKKGYAADICVFDWKNVKDNNTVVKTDQAPSGIEMVFINGRKVAHQGKADGSISAGLVL